MKTSTKYFLLTKPVSLKSEAAHKGAESLVIEPHTYKNVYVLTGEMRKTGLMAPYPEEMRIIVNHDGCRFLILSEQLKDCFFQMPQVEHGDRLVLKEDVEAFDNCISLAKKITIPKGTVLEATSPYGTNRGHYFFNYQGQSCHLKNTFCPHPSAMPLLVNSKIELSSN